MNTKYDPQYVVKVLEFLGHREAGGITEVRIFPKDRYLVINRKREYVGKVVSGYYDDYEKLAREAEPFDGKGNIYITVNPCKPELLARAANRLQFAANTTTSDDDILCDLWFPYDVDPVRPAEISSTNDELRAALARRDEVAECLLQWAVSIKGVSGNGGHGLIRLIGYPNNQQTRQAKERLTHFLMERFTDEQVSLDNTVFNMARIWKLYGTLAVKGDNVPERPHRRSYLEIPDTIPEPVDLYSKLGEIIPSDWTPKDAKAIIQPKRKKTKTNDDYQLLDVDAYLAGYSVSLKKRKEKADGTYWELERCPFDPSHSRGEAVVIQFNNGAMAFKCHHNSCADKNWNDFKAAVGDPKPLYESYQEPNRKAVTQEVNLLEVKEEKPSAGEVALQFLNTHFTEAGIFTLRYYREDWWQWNGKCYQEMYSTDLRARLALFIDDETSREVSQSFLSSVLEALGGRCLVLADAAPPVWLMADFEVKPAGHILVFENGWIDFGAILAGENVEVQSHTPKLFTPVALPYAFDPDAECPEWLKFLSHNLEGDEGRIAVLQEFVGYCFMWDTKLHKFLILEGEGANGKSVFTKVVVALLGKENVSHVPLEMFGQRFALYPTLGKLANIVGEVGELDTVAEGQLKAFVAGDPMQFERKYRESIMAEPTARLIIATNNRPRFVDRSEGLWRRMLLVPWNVQIPEDKQDPELANRIIKNELAGVFRWALAGLARLHAQGRFTKAKVVEEAVGEYKLEGNPARVFLEENYKADAEGVVPRDEIYQSYKEWCESYGFHPLNNANFGKEIRRVFPRVQTVHKQEPTGKRYRVYCGLALRND